MLKQYAVNTIQWEEESNNGYGASYASPVDVENVYIEKDSKLIRGADDTTKSMSLAILFEEVAFNKGDRITFPDSSTFKITQITKYYKPRSTNFDHLELILGEE